MAGSFYFQDGQLKYKNPLYSFFHGGVDSSGNGAISDDMQQYLLEFNQAQQQYQQQYQLQQQEFGLNKQIAESNIANQQFNQELATRQQNLSEESYYNGIRNQASQLSSLGINPAASGSSLSGGTMSGGSSVGNASSLPSSGRPTGRAIQRFSRDALKAQMLSGIMQYAVQKRQLDIASYNAQTDRIRANNDSARVDIEDRSANAEIDFKRAQTIWQEFQNDSFEYGEEKFKVLGLSHSIIQSLRNVNSATALALGLVSVLNGNPDSPGGFSLGVIYAYENLNRQQKRAFNDFYAEHPDYAEQGSMLTANRMNDWINFGFGYDDVYESLSNYYKE